MIKIEEGYVLYNIIKDMYDDDGYYADIICADVYTKLEPAMNELDSFDDPEEWQVKKVKITYEVTDIQ